MCEHSKSIQIIYFWWRPVILKQVLPHLCLVLVPFYSRQNSNGLLLNFKKSIFNTTYIENLVGNSTEKKNPRKWSRRMGSGSLANPACDLLVCSHSVVTEQNEGSLPTRCTGGNQNQLLLLNELYWEHYDNDSSNFFLLCSLISNQEHSTTWMPLLFPMYLGNLT